jgi:DNA repair protein RecO (recombination protein O)
MTEPRSARGFIIARLPFGNTSLIVRCLTEQAGRLTFMAKGANRPKSPLTGTLDLFYLDDFLYQPSRSGDMHTLREARVVEPNLGLRRSYPNLMAAQYFAELIEAITESGTPLPGEYALLAKAITYLGEADVTWRAVERFEQRILTLHGVGQGAQGDLPHAFRTLHHAVPALRVELMKLLVNAAN